MTRNVSAALLSHSRILFRWTLRPLAAAALGVTVLAGALPASATTPADHQAEQPEPIQLGSTGGNINDRSSRYCCGGTLGGLVTTGTSLYILSNNHVLARSNQAELGELIIHPGLIDQNPTCAQAGEDTVGSLINFVPLLFKSKKNVPLNEVDAAVAEVVPGTVSADGAILGIGPLSGSTVAAFIGQTVQKSGRTTGHTQGVVAALGVTVEVGYSQECGGRATNVARFTDQIRIDAGDFSAGGDSGSVIVESGAADPQSGLPRAVGLLFAGSSSSTLANPIDRVLALLDVAMVQGTPGPSGSLTGIVTRSADGTPIAGATVTADTGQSAATGEDGSYQLTSVPEGDRTVTAKATGFDPQTLPVTVLADTAGTLNFALEASLVATQSIVQCITYTTSGGRNSSRDLLITSNILDDKGAPVVGAEVRITVSRDGSVIGSGSGALTDSAGNATYKVGSARNGSYSTVVTEVVSPLTFEGSTPSNLFRKGTDASPDSDCRDDAAQPSGGTAQPSAVAGASGKAAYPSAGRADVARAIRIKSAHESRLFAIEDVVGAGVGISSDGTSPVIEVYLSREGQGRGQVPAQIDGIPTRVLVTGSFQAH